MKEIIDGLNLPKQIIDKTEKFMSTLFGSSAKEIGELFADKIRYSRMKNQIKIFKKTIDILEKNGMEAKQINLKTLVPLIEQSSLEEDELIQDKWANLIANISSSPENGLEPKLVKTLSDLSSIEAQILDFSYLECLEERERIFAESENSKSSRYNSIEDVKFSRVVIKKQLVKEKFNLSDGFTTIFIDNLEALGLIKYEDPNITIDNGFTEGFLLEGGQHVEIELDVTADFYPSDDFKLTTYGIYFINQCDKK